MKTGWIPNVHNQALWCNLAAVYNHEGKDIVCITIGSENQALRFCDMHYLVGLYLYKSDKESKLKEFYDEERDRLSNIINNSGIENKNEIINLRNNN